MDGGTGVGVYFGGGGGGVQDALNKIDEAFA
jgi:hypothetical protein